MIKVSVLIPFYNCEKYLDKCLRSVRQQTLSQIEIICIDDGSTDTSLQIVKKHSKIDNRIIVMHQRNQGAAIARNVGIKKARGEYVFFLDADDLISKTALDNLYTFASEHLLKVCGGSLCRIKNGRKIVDTHSSHRGYVFRENAIIDYCDYQFDLGFCRFIYSRYMLIDNQIYFPHYKNYEDPVFFVKALKKAGKIGTISQTVYYYRVVDNSSSNQLHIDNTLDMVQGMRDVLKFAEQNDLRTLYQLTFRRLDVESSSTIERVLNEEDDNRELFDLLMKVNSEICWDWIGESKDEILQALKMVYSEYKKYEYFRNTLVGKLLRKIRNGYL